MDTDLVKLLTRAVREGLEIALIDGIPSMRGHASPATIDTLRERRWDVQQLLAGGCAACGAPPWIHEHGTSIPWCRPCARRRGLQLLRHEHPELITTQDVA